MGKEYKLNLGDNSKVKNESVRKILNSLDDRLKDIVKEVFNGAKPNEAKMSFIDTLEGKLVELSVKNGLKHEEIGELKYNAMVRFSHYAIKIRDLKEVSKKELEGDLIRRYESHLEGLMGKDYKRSVKLSKEYRKSLFDIFRVYESLEMLAGLSQKYANKVRPY